VDDYTTAPFPSCNSVWLCPWWCHHGISWLHHPAQHVHVVALHTTFQPSPQGENKLQVVQCSLSFASKYHRCTEEVAAGTGQQWRRLVADKSKGEHAPFCSPCRSSAAAMKQEGEEIVEERRKEKDCATLGYFGGSRWEYFDLIPCFWMSFKAAI
jgi:hypothetical protein